MNSALRKQTPKKREMKINQSKSFWVGGLNVPENSSI